MAPSYRWPRESGLTFDLDEHRIDCPYCGEAITVMVDTSAGDQEYIEDCQVCCRPINFRVDLDADGSAMVQCWSDSD